MNCRIVAHSENSQMIINACESIAIKELERDRI